MSTLTRQSKRSSVTAKVASNVAASVRREERHLIARRLYDLELKLGIVFHTIGNLGDCGLAGEQLETLLDEVREMREGYES